MAEGSGEKPNPIIYLKYPRVKEDPMVTRHLPEELILDLLSRLPVKSLLRFRCVCKHWYALTMDPDFIKMHLNQSLATNTHINLIFKYPNYLSLDLDATEQVGTAVVEDLDSAFERRAKVVGSCNGLLCISNSDEGLYLWNRSTRRHQNLPATFKYPQRSASPYRNFIYGFGYEPITDDYKIIRIILSNGNQTLVEVYSLSTNSWRKIKNLPQHIDTIYGIGFVANSAIHWKEITSKFIVSFDLKDEEFGNLSLPQFVEDGSSWNIGVLVGKLCIVNRFYGDRVEVWTMKEYGVRDSWVKLFSIENLWVTMSTGGIMPLCYSRNGQIVLQHDSEALVLYDFSTKILKFLGIQGAWDVDSYSHVCVGSLIPLNDKD